MSRIFAPALPQVAAQTPAGPKCPAVANGSPGKKIEACGDDAALVTFCDKSRWHIPLTQPDLGCLVEALHHEVLRPQCNPVIAILSIGLSKGRGRILCADERCKEWVAKKVPELLFGAFISWDEDCAPAIKCRKLKVLLRVKDRPFPEAFLMELRSQNPGLDTEGWSNLSNKVVAGVGHLALWKVPKLMALRLIDPGVFWAVFPLKFVDVNAAKHVAPPPQFNEQGNAQTHESGDEQRVAGPRTHEEPVGEGNEDVNRQSSPVPGHGDGPAS